MRWFCCLAMAFRLTAQCLPVEGEFIVARQIAAVNPEFAGLPPEIPLGRAPMAGLRRAFQTAELRRLATAHGLADGSYSEVCFQWPLAPLDRGRVMETMRNSLIQKHARLELLDTPRLPAAPPGELVFPISSLKPAGNGAYAWAGYVRYGQDRHFPVRTGVRIWIPGVRLVARDELRPGHPVTAQQVAEESGEFPLERRDAMTDIAAIIGKTARRSLAAGSVLRRADFVEPVLVTAGQTVDVEVSNGATRLVAVGEAEQSGRRGDVIAVRNPASGFRFRARVERAGSVALAIGPVSSLERNIPDKP